MANFKSIIGNVLHFLAGAEPAIETGVKLIIPASAPFFALLDPIVAKFQHAVITVEATAPDGTAGSVKSDAVFADFEAGLELTNSILAAKGEKLDYDHVSLQAAINAQVEAFRQMAVVKASIRTVPLVAAAGAAS